MKVKLDGQEDLLQNQFPETVNYLEPGLVCQSYRESIYDGHKAVHLTQSHLNSNLKSEESRREREIDDNGFV